VFWVRKEAYCCREELWWTVSIFGESRKSVFDRQVRGSLKAGVGTEVLNSERDTEVVNWEPMDLEESDCLIKTKQRDRLQMV
jgi:hypothetical protein